MIIKITFKFRRSDFMKGRSVRAFEHGSRKLHMNNIKPALMIVSSENNLHSILLSSVVIYTQAISERSDIRQTNSVRKHSFLQETVARNFRD